MNDNGGSDVDRTSLLTTPLSQRGVPVWLIYSLAESAKEMAELELRAARGD